MYDPRLREFATESQQKYFDALEKHGSARAAAKAMGLNKCAVQDVIDRVRNRAAKQGYSPVHNMVHTVPDGFDVKGVSTYFNADGQAVGQWVKSRANAERQRELMEAAFAAMSEQLPRVKPSPQPKKVNESLCNLLVFTDYHMGQLAWHKEGGADWDLKIAEALMLSSFIHMIDSAPKAKSLVLCLQGDLLHTDGLLPLTPAHKNVLDADGRFSKIVATTIRVLRKIIEYALSRHDSIHLIICEGNHDETGSMWLRQMFAALYEVEPRMSVNDSELPFYVFQHGEVMLAFHHGHKVRNEDLPMLFAAQHSVMWGQTKKRYAHCGHRHHVDEKEYAGMTVTQHPTLAARDAHASRGGWISERAAYLITYHERFGQVARTIVCPEMFEQAA
jgi:hypothetical protein